MALTRSTYGQRVGRCRRGSDPAQQRRRGSGQLTVAGYAVEDLAPHASVEEVAYLLLHGCLPEPLGARPVHGSSGGAASALRAHARRSSRGRAAKAPPMDALRMAAPMLSLGRAENPLDDAMTAIASFPTIVGSLLAAAARAARRSRLVRTSRTRAHYLHQLFGVEPSAERARGARHLSQHGLRPRPQRLDVRGARDRLDALRPGLGGHRRGRRAQGAAARRRTRAGPRHGLRDRRRPSAPSR